MPGYQLLMIANLLINAGYEWGRVKDAMKLLEQLWVYLTSLIVFVCAFRLYFRLATHTL
jgi:hypothetical protein